MNPYATSDLVVSAQAAGAQVSEAQFLGAPQVYFPPSLPLFAPLALLPWTLAKAVWITCLVGAAFWFLVAIVRQAKAWSVPVACLLLSFAPLHAGFGKGQPSILVCALIAASLATPQPYLGGILLGIAACIKPQLALGFLLLAIGLRQGQKLIAACTTGLVVCAAALLWMKPGSLATWLSNLSAGTAGSGLMSGSNLNPLSFQLINVDTLIPPALFGMLAVSIVYALIAFVTALAVAREPDPRMAAAVIAAAVVLVGYQRFYNAQILWLGIPAMLFLVQGRMSLVLRAAYAVFLVPGQTIAATWLHLRPDGPWSLLLLRHEALACVVMWLIFAGTAIKRGNFGRDIAQNQTLQRTDAQQGAGVGELQGASRRW
jgi:hypothetical protein